MEMNTTYAGMDVHAAKIQVAVLVPGTKHRTELELENEPRALKRLARRLKKIAPDGLLACYEAAPGGFSVQRTLQAEGVECHVIAPALIPRRPGDRVKTDRRDARKLAELLRAELLTVVHPPTVQQEATRDICRAREAAVADRKRARHRLAKFCSSGGSPTRGPAGRSSTDSGCGRSDGSSPGRRRPSVSCCAPLSTPRRWCAPPSRRSKQRPPPMTTAKQSGSSAASVGSTP